MVLYVWGRGYLGSGVWYDSDPSCHCSALEEGLNPVAVGETGPEDKCELLWIKFGNVLIHSIILPSTGVIMLYKMYFCVYVQYCWASSYNVECKKCWSMISCGEFSLGCILREAKESGVFDSTHLPFTSRWQTGVTFNFFRVSLCCDWGIIAFAGLKVQSWKCLI